MQPQFLPGGIFSGGGKYLRSAANGMIEAELIFPAEDKVDGFAIYDSEGKEVEFSLISREKGPMDVFSPINLPGIIEVGVAGYICPCRKPHLSLYRVILCENVRNVPLQWR